PSTPPAGGSPDRGEPGDRPRQPAHPPRAGGPQCSHLPAPAGREGSARDGEGGGTVDGVGGNAAPLCDVPLTAIPLGRPFPYNRALMKQPPHDWSPFLAAERPVERFSFHGRHRLALAYANTYHVGMSSLGFQRVYELVHGRPDWSCERFFEDGFGMPVSVESKRPLDEFSRC